ncbi:hypothetical protein HY416_03730 [Candidatus Kaiserbacteria bacterium]|nr:hypothetical protein [Candidatus Kaiserbacteria bacterium]
MLRSLNTYIEKLTAQNRHVFVFLLCVTLFAYGTILFGTFVFDDNTFIEHNAQIRSLGNIGDIYASNTTAGAGLVGDNFYRPNQQFIFAVLYSLFDLTPFFFHLTSLVFHILNGCLVFLLFLKIGLRRRTAFFGSLVFLLHPILTEAVSYISGLSDPLVTSTILLTLFVFLESIRTMPLRRYLRLLLLGVAIFSFGLFSKENQIVSVGLCAALALFAYKRGRLPRVFPAVVFIGVLAIIASLYVYARLTVLDFMGVVGLTSEVSDYTQSVWVRLATFVHIVPEYFKMMLFPWHLNYEKPYVVHGSLMNIQSGVGLLILLAIGAVVCAALIRKRPVGKTLPGVALGLSWFVIALLPVSGLIPINAMYLEHWLYLPIIGMILAVCFLGEFLARKIPPVAGTIAVIALSVVLVLCIARIMTRNVEWSNPIRFYENELRYTQTSARIYTDLGMELAARGDCDTAIEHYKKAVALNDIYPQTHHNMAQCLVRERKPQEAANEYLNALAIQPGFIYSISGLANLLASVGDARSAAFSELENRAAQGHTITHKDIVNALAER